VLRLDHVYVGDRFSRSPRKAASNRGFWLGVAVTLLLLAICSPPAAALGDPKGSPESLWEAYPLTPKNKRRHSALLPPVVSAPQTPEAVAEDASPDNGGTNVTFFLFVGGAGVIVLGVLWGLAAVRTRRLASARSPSVPLWQGTAGLEAGLAWQSVPTDVDSPRRPSPRTTRPNLSPRRSAGRQSPLQRRRERRRHLRWFAPRIRDVVWTEDSAPLLMGSAVAVLAALVIVYLVG